MLKNVLKYFKRCTGHWNDYSSSLYHIENYRLCKTYIQKSSIFVESYCMYYIIWDLRESVTWWRMFCFNGMRIMIWRTKVRKLNLQYIAFTWNKNYTDVFGFLPLPTHVISYHKGAILLNYTYVGTHIIMLYMNMKHQAAIQNNFWSRSTDQYWIRISNKVFRGREFKKSKYSNTDYSVHDFFSGSN